MTLSKFDELYKKTIQEAMDDEVSPLEQEGEGEFSDKDGDFPEEDESKEMDLVEELKDMRDKLDSIIAQFDEEHSDSEEGTEGEELSEEDVVKECELKPLPKYKKLSMAVVSAIKAASGKAKTAKGQSQLKKTNLDTNKNMKVASDLQNADKGTNNLFNK